MTGRIVGIFYIFFLSRVYSWCNSAYSCVGQTYSGAGQLTFSGYKSAYGPNTSYSGNGSVICQGTLSCDSIAFIHSEGDIICRGRESCSHSKDVQSSSKIWCSGQLSCSFSNLTSLDIDCAGYLSCRNSFISGVSTITANGLFSLYQAIIEHAATDHHLTIELHGSYAGFGGLLLCTNGATCNINCNAYESCHMFYLDCKQATCNVDVRDTVIPAIVPLYIANTSYNHSSVRTLPQLFPFESTISTNDTSCSVDEWNYDDYDENRNGTINIPANSDASACCRAAHSCASNVLTLANNDLVCGAYFACGYAVIHDHTGNIYCEGQQACLGISVHRTNVLYCAGRNACQQANVQMVSYVICSGRSACDRSNFTSGGTDLNVYMSALEAGGEATMIHCEETDTCNVYCNGLNSCINTKIFCACAQNCNVECNTQEQYCPDVFHGTQCSSLYPSFSPTFPIIEPSVTDPIYHYKETDNDRDGDEANNNALFYISLPITLPVLVVTIVIVAVFCVVFCWCLKRRANRRRQANKQQQATEMQETKHDECDDDEISDDGAGQGDSFDGMFVVKLGEESVSKSQKLENVHHCVNTEGKDDHVAFHGTKGEYYDEYNHQIYEERIV